MSIWWLVAIGVFVGGALGGGAYALVGRDTPPAPAPLVESDPLARQYDHGVAFMRAWTKFRTGTFVAELRVERTVAGLTDPLVSEGLIVQAPPARIVNGWGGQVTTVGDKEQSCALGEEDQAKCGTVATKESYTNEVALELSTFSQYFSGREPLYKVDRSSDDCFELTLFRSRGLPPYGDRAQFCFDSATGAFTVFETASAAGRDRVTATRISATVTPDDFRR